MGGTLLGAVSAHVGALSCCVCEKAPEKTQPFVDQGVSLLSAEQVAARSDFIFLAVKPQVMQAVVSGLSEALRDNQDAVLVTMAAGLDIATIEKYVGRHVPVIRIMPNMPCSVGQGVVLYCANNLVSPDAKAEFVSLLDKVGLLDEIAESDIDAASVISGCGPAFVYLFADALAEGAAQCGLDKQRALLYAVRTLIGAATLLERSDKDVEELIRVVCSPKGTTIEGIDTLNRHDLRGIVGDAVQASYRRSLELKG